MKQQEVNLGSGRILLQKNASQVRAFFGELFF